MLLFNIFVSCVVLYTFVTSKIKTGYCDPAATLAVDKVIILNFYETTSCPPS